MASAKPISTIKTAFPSFDTFFYIAVVVVIRILLVLVIVIVLILVLVVAAVVVVVVLVSLLPCNLSSTQLGGMRGAIE